MLVLLLTMDKPFVVATGSVLLSCAVTGTGALTRVISHHADGVQQAGEKLQGEVKHTNPKA